MMEQAALLDMISAPHVDSDTFAEFKNEFELFLCTLSDDEKVREINKIKLFIHNLSPLKNEPVDCVLWVKLDEVVANDYNPNKVAPPEMTLLEQSISEDG